MLTTNKKTVLLSEINKGTVFIYPLNSKKYFRFINYNNRLKYWHYESLKGGPPLITYQNLTIQIFK